MDCWSGIGRTIKENKGVLILFENENKYYKK